MHHSIHHWLLFCLALPLSGQDARELLLQLAPEADAPVIAKVIASDKVILDAAPAEPNADEGWRQLALPTPFEGYVPTATLDKNLEISPGTAVRYLPTSESAKITEVKPDDRYEVVRENNDWATVRFDKPVTGYFRLGSGTETTVAEAARSEPRAPAAGEPEPTRTIARPEKPVPQPILEPLTIPAARGTVNPDVPISQVDPDSLPPENVTWRPARARRAEADRKPAGNPETSSPLAEPIMVPADQTQAREAAPEPAPGKVPRLLTGQLLREIEADGPSYPIRLRSPEGRLIAYVDLSGIYIPDVDPYLGEKVYIRGQIHPLPETSGQLVILAESLRLGE